MSQDLLHGYGGHFIAHEANGTLSREQVIIDATDAAVIKAGTVLGMITASGKYRIYKPGSVDGSETAVAVLYEDVDVTAAEARGTVINGPCEVNRGELIIDATAVLATVVTELEAVWILARRTV